MNSDSSDSDIEFTFGCPPDDFVNPGRPLHLIPARSAGKYDFFYNKFIEWCKEKNTEDYTETVILEFFKQKAKTYKPTTLWAYYSMLKATLEAYHSIDIRKFRKVFLFVKQQSIGYKATKSKVFTMDEVNRFLKEAPDQLYLMWKVALIMGITGGCRRKELTNMTVDDIDDFGSTLVVKVPDEKTKLQRTFTVTAPRDNEIDLIQVYRKYAALRPGKTPHRRLFINYRAGRCSIQVVGVNTFGKLPSLIAAYLGLPNHNRYTGHCFRRSSMVLARGRGFKSAGITNVGASDQPFDNQISMEDDILQLRKIIPPIPEDTASDPDETEVSLKQSVQPASSVQESRCGESLGTHGDNDLDGGGNADADPSPSRNWSIQEQGSFDAEQSNVTIEENIKQEYDEDYCNILGTSEDDCAFHSDFSPTIRTPADNRLTSVMHAKCNKSRCRPKRPGKCPKEPSCSERSRLTWNDDDDTDETNLFFASIASAVGKLPELLRAQIRLKVATLVGSIEIEHYLNRRETSVNHICTAEEMEINETVPDDVEEVGSSTVSKRRRLELQRKRLKSTDASNGRRTLNDCCDEVEPFFTCAGKVVKKLKDLSRAQVRLKVASIVGNAEIEHLSSSERPQDLSPDQERPIVNSCLSVSHNVDTTSV